MNWEKRKLKPKSENLAEAYFEAIAKDNLENGHFPIFRENSFLLSEKETNDGDGKKIGIIWGIGFPEMSFLTTLSLK